MCEGSPCAGLRSPRAPSQHASHAPVDQWYHMTASSRVCSMCSEHEEQRRLCSPQSWVSHQCQLARWCARFTTCGLGCEGACGMWSLRHFVALYARILILRTEHVRCRGGQQQRQQIAAYAAACEFVARLWGESEGDEHGAVYQPRCANCEKSNLLIPPDSLHVVAPGWYTTAAGVSRRLLRREIFYGLSSARRSQSLHRAQIRHVQCAS